MSTSSAPVHPRRELSFMRAGIVNVQLPGKKSQLRWSVSDGAGEAPVLTQLLSTSGHALNTRCGGRGLCQGCRVNLTEGAVLAAEGVVKAPAEIRACQARAAEVEISIEVPLRSLLAHRPQICTRFATRVSGGARALIPVRDGICDHGLAIDIGTTTVVVALVDLRDGRIVAEAAEFNKQIALGDNVLTRIELCMNDPVMLRRLQHAIQQETLVPLVREVCRESGLGFERIGAVVIAGNTTMLHLFCGKDPTGMGHVPFTPQFLDHRVETPTTLGWVPENANDDWLGANVPVHLLPGYSAFVGADITAGYYCSGMIYNDAPTLLVDIGTNGEILCQRAGKLLAAATAAGPAFEGTRLQHGCRAVAGAVSAVRFGAAHWPAELERIPGSVHCPGLCGTAYVDFLAEARRTGLLTEQGRFNPAIYNALPKEAQRQGPWGKALQLHPDWPTATISEADVAELLQAKAAVAAGINTLLHQLGLTAADIATVYLAGGFGMHLRLANATACGLLPGFLPEQIALVGNTALGGAYLALLDETVIPEMVRSTGRAETVELNQDPDFEDRYLDALGLL
ncbi:MAG: ASKHA domain-containing protein [Verrucomicrobiota bacterium]|nr:ASKHA domain-containing protein [Verrucomicrobiota bacterium]